MPVIGLYSEFRVVQGVCLYAWSATLPTLAQISGSSPLE